jgi:hypothetical protein
MARKRPATPRATNPADTNLAPVTKSTPVSSEIVWPPSPAAKK